MAERELYQYKDRNKSLLKL